MGEEILVKDGVKYRLWDYDKDEVKNFEPIVVEHIKDIFGDESEYFPKTLIEPIPGISKKREPDGFIIDFNNKEWFILELKILGDYAISEIANQINDYKEIKRRQQLKTIVSSIKKQVEDENRKNLISDIVLEKDPQIVIIINSLEGGKGKQFKSRAKSADKLREFKTFRRENTTGVHIYLIEPLYKTKIIQPAKPSEAPPQKPLEEGKKRARKGEKTPQEIYKIPILESLIEVGGSGKTNDILDAVGEKVKNILKDMDYETLQSGMDIRWRNTAMWARNTMVKERLLKPLEESGRGIWKISEKGQRYYEENKNKWGEKYLQK